MGILKPAYRPYKHVLDGTRLNDYPIGDQRRFGVLQDMVKSLRKLPWWKRINWKPWRKEG